MFKHINTYLQWRHGKLAANREELGKLTNDVNGTSRVACGGVGTVGEEYDVEILAKRALADYIVELT